MSVSLQEKCGMYYAVFRAKDREGKTIQKWIKTDIPVKRGNKRYAMLAAREIAEKYEKHELVACEKIHFWEWIEQWLEKKELEVEPNTYQGYLSYYRTHIGPYFKQHDVMLDRMTLQDIQGYFNEKAQKPGKKVKGKQSGQSLRKHNVIIHGALEDAVRNNLIPYNYADRVTLPRMQKYHGSFYTREQVLQLLEAVKGTVLEGIVTLTVYYGLRRSEAVGLKWSAVDFERGTVSIESTVVEFTDVLEKETTKNKASRRTYPMSPDVRSLLLSLRAKQEEMKALQGSSYRDSGYVFTWEDGSLLRPDYVSEKFQTILKANNLPHIRFHDLRHTTASLLIQDGMDIKRVSEWLGHSDVGTTANIYAHLNFDSKIQTAEKMGALLAPSDNTYVHSEEKC